MTEMRVGKQEGGEEERERRIEREMRRGENKRRGDGMSGRGMGRRGG